MAELLIEKVNEVYLQDSNNFTPHIESKVFDLSGSSYSDAGTKVKWTDIKSKVCVCPKKLSNIFRYRYPSYGFNLISEERYVLSGN